MKYNTLYFRRCNFDNLNALYRRQQKAQLHFYDEVCATFLRYICTRTFTETIRWNQSPNWHWESINITSIVIRNLPVMSTPATSYSRRCQVLWEIIGTTRFLCIGQRQFPTYRSRHLNARLITTWKNLMTKNLIWAKRAIFSTLPTCRLCHNSFLSGRTCLESLFNSRSQMFPDRDILP